MNNMEKKYGWRMVNTNIEELKGFNISGGNNIIHIHFDENGNMKEVKVVPMQDTEAASSVDNCSDEGQAILENRIFVRQVSCKGVMHELDVSALKAFFERHFVKDVQYLYDWCALRFFCINHRLLKVDSAKEFAGQMNCEGWFPDVEKACSADGMGDFWYLKNVGRHAWHYDTMVPPKNTSLSGFRRLCKLYDDMEMEFRMEDVVI